MSDWGNTENVRILFGFAPMGICMKRPGSLTLAVWASGSYVFKVFSLQKYVYIHEQVLIALNADKFYDLCCTLRKQFLSTSRLHSGSGKIEDDIHSPT